ncbi:MAG: DNA (cytosine-5-)-methyltransferase [Thermoprotei archaeon]|nr:MAG: DNA (cytosine-5-)-methyltransferase [Thermoprotei archaeon]
MRKGALLVDLFCGAGGFALGFKEEGFNIALGLDNDRSAARTFISNFPGAITLVDDIRNVSCDDIRYMLRGREVDVVIGSPPCEPFTGANPRRRRYPLDRLYKDPVGALVLEFVRLTRCLNPKVFVMENVPAILDGELREALRREFLAAGYNVFFNILRAEDYGTPSRRVRVFISNIKLRPRRVRRIVKVWEAIGDLPMPSNDPVIPNHEPPPKLSTKKMKRVQRTRWRESLITYEGAGGKQLPNLIRLHPYGIAPTVLGSSRFIHPFENRLLTVREQARLMGFPDSHVFLGGRDEQYNQVGEAVPPPLAKAIARDVVLTTGRG